MNKPKLILFDIDGVLTDCKAFYDSDSYVPYKQYNYKDITALRRFKKELDIDIALFTGSKEINQTYAKSKKIKCYYVNPNITNKVEKLNYICMLDGLKPSQVGFVGDDYQDYEIMNAVGFKYCPCDAIYDVRNIEGVVVLPIRGGDGVADCVFSTIKYNLKNDEYCNSNSRKKFFFFS
jgi:3-deoxy-D-manno-octulosonate 8-phosphate phosphatase (KDO 8-P phosphatase)